MTHFDVFNGDADGLCALHQLRLEAPLESTLVTGVNATWRCSSVYRRSAVTRSPRLIYVLPDAAWSRRVCGVFGNHLANRFPDLAHAILTPDARGGYMVNVRAPATLRTGADTLCRQFSTGGGRAEAAGINHLPRNALPDFARRFANAFSSVPPLP